MSSIGPNQNRFVIVQNYFLKIWRSNLGTSWSTFQHKPCTNGI